MKVKIKRNNYLACVDISHDLLRNERLIRLGKEPVFLEAIEIPKGAGLLELEIKGMFIKVRFFKKKLG